MRKQSRLELPPTACNRQLLEDGRLGDTEGAVILNCHLAPKVTATGILTFYLLYIVDF